MKTKHTKGNWTYRQKRGNNAYEYIIELPGGQNMRTQLKKAIIEFIFENEKEFQITNHTTNHFRAYIYDEKGEYLIGGEEVAEFIKQAIKLILK